MKSSRKLLFILSFSILPVAIMSVVRFPRPQFDVLSNFNNTTFWWIIQALLLLLFWVSKNYFFEKANSDNLQVVKWYLWWNIFSFSRGLFIAEVYWDWKGLVANTFALLLPIVAFSATNKMLMQSIFSFFIRFSLPLFAVFAFLISKDAFGFFLVPISFLLLFLPAFTMRWKVILLFVSVFVIVADLGARSNVIKFAVPILISSIYYYRQFISNNHFELVRKLLFITPFILFGLAITGVFNVFKMEEYISGEYESVSVNAAEESTQNLIADTRTFLYVDVLKTADKYNTWWIGRSPARGNETEYFEESDVTGRGERLGNEVAILNIFTWTGIVGVLLYLVIFYKASNLAVNFSNNIYAKFCGLFIAFRWLYGWVEDINYFTLTTFMLWLTIGICFSKSFRKMSNKEVQQWVQGVFDKKLKMKTMVS